MHKDHEYSVVFDDCAERTVERMEVRAVNAQRAVNRVRDTLRAQGRIYRVTKVYVHNGRDTEAVPNTEWR